MDHIILFSFFENHIDIRRHALKFFRSYPDDRIQRASVEGVLTEVNRLIFGVPQGSVLASIDFFIYTLSISATLIHYKFDYHINSHELLANLLYCCRIFG